MTISFVIPLYNCLALTQVMLKSLRATLPTSLSHEIIFVDDSSTDGTRDWLQMIGQPATYDEPPRKQSLESCRYILNEENAGFAKTCNRGAQAATGEFIIFLNNDLVLLPRWLEPLLDGMLSSRKYAAMGNLHLRADNDKLDHAGIMITPQGKIAHIQTLPRRANRLDLMAVPAISAACLMIRRSVFLELNGFDQAFINGGEDVDFCFRLQSRGLKCGIALKSTIRHHVSASRGPTSDRDERNSWRLVQRWENELIWWGARTWSQAQVGQNIRRPWTKPGRLALRALPFAFGWTRQVPAYARCLLTSALYREKIRWERLFNQHPGARRAPPGPQLYSTDGFLNDEIPPGSTRLREQGTIRLPPGFPGRSLMISGFVLPPPKNQPEADGPIGFRLTINQDQILEFPNLPVGIFNLGTPAPLVKHNRSNQISIELIGVSRTNFYAWIARLLHTWPLPAQWHLRLQPYRRQALNRRLRFVQILGDDEVIYDFGHFPPLHRYLRNPILTTSVNLIGWFRAAVGIGESVRCMAKACDAVQLPAALIDLRLPCLNRRADETYTNRLQESAPYQINIFHIDPPVCEHIDHHHGPELRHDRYNIAYWAWELAEFPDAWIKQQDYFDEIWCPSEFVRAAIAQKINRPVFVMPHAIDFPIPTGDGRARFQLPPDRFLFLFAYDLNSAQERKNPLAVIAAYRLAFPQETGVGLVIKTQNPDINREAFAELSAAIQGLTQVTLITETLERNEVYLLQKTCDAFVSLHRAEGFGLAVAECMHLGKPVIATNWSATAEYLNSQNGIPIPYKLTQIKKTHGPYQQGQTWAEPDVESAARAMQQLLTVPGLAARLGSAAAKTIQDRFSPSVIGTLYQKRLQALFPTPRPNDSIGGSLN